MTAIANQMSNETININEQLYELDARGVRAFVRYSTVNGK